MKPFPILHAALGAVLALTLAADRTSAQAPRNTIVVRVGLHSVAESGAAAVALDHALRTGDRFRLTVRPDQDGYLYLYYRKGQEAGVRLWPAGAGAHPVEAGKEVTVPASGNLRVTSDPGQDTIQLFFARQPVSDPDALAMPRTRPKVRQIRLRAIDLEAQPGAAVAPTAFSADLDDQGVAVLEIPLGKR
jgi:Domain of unknown function (DUF4384)